MKQDQIEIIYERGNLKSNITNSCPFWDYKVFKDWLEPGKKLGTGYCKHPLIDDAEIECSYGLSEIKVPSICPLKEGQLVQILKEGQLVQKVKLILGED